jgi:hypothetical protein
MSGDSDNDGEVLDFGKRPSVFEAMRSRAAPAGEKEDDDEEMCPAFCSLRGIRDRALALELQFRDGNREWLSYSLLASFRHNPSVGLLLKFTSDLVSLVLIRGSNLDLPVGQNGIHLTGGLQRHRITRVREMDEEELRKAGDGEPTIDRIEVAEFETQEEVQAWLKKVAPVFVRP